MSVFVGEGLSEIIEHYTDWSCDRCGPARYLDEADQYLCKPCREEYISKKWFYASLYGLALLVGCCIAEYLYKRFENMSNTSLV
jgi:hypothetical protein